MVFNDKDRTSLNPSYTGIWSRGSIPYPTVQNHPIFSLNPSYTGIWSRGANRLYLRLQVVS